MKSMNSMNTLQLRDVASAGHATQASAEDLAAVFGQPNLGDANALVIELENDLEDAKYQNDQLREKVQLLEQDVERKEVKIKDLEKENATLKVEKIKLQDEKAQSNANNNGGASMFACLCCGLGETTNNPNGELGQRLIDS